MDETAEHGLPPFDLGPFGLSLRYRVRHALSDSLRDENGNVIVHRPVRWRTSTIRVADQMYVETTEAGTRKQKRSVSYLDASTLQPMVVVSGSLLKGDLSAQICASTEEQFEFSMSGRWSNAVVRGTTRSREPVFCLRFLGNPYFGPHDIQVLLSREAPSAGLLLTAYSVAQHWHLSRYQWGA